jgi:hypothetical protein
MNTGTPNNSEAAVGAPEPVKVANSRAPAYNKFTTEGDSLMWLKCFLHGRQFREKNAWTMEACLCWKTVPQGTLSPYLILFGPYRAHKDSSNLNDSSSYIGIDPGREYH